MIEGRKMKRYAAVLIACFVLGIQGAYAQSDEESGSKPFHFSSRGTSFGVQGEFEGTYVIHQDSIEVTVAKATIYVSENCPYQGRRSINHLKFGLAVELGPDKRWKIETAGQPIPLQLVMSPKDQYSLHDLYFFIPKERNVDLSKRWFVVEIQTDALDVPGEKSGKGYVYAFSWKDIFLPDDRKDK
jgi:hypothetical protein